MAAVDLRGKLIFLGGAWGRSMPAAGVSVEIVDKDVGNPDDTIWRGSTDAKGEFSGRSAEWRDTVSTTVSNRFGSITTTADDLTDALALTAKFSQRIGTRQYSITVPFAPAIPGMPIVPIVLPWGPPAAGRVTVNGAPLRSLSQFATLIGQLFGQGTLPGTGHSICVFGEQAAMLKRQMPTLEPALRDLETRILDALRAERGQVGRPGGLAMGPSSAGMQQMRQTGPRQAGSIGGSLPAPASGSRFQSGIGAGAAPGPWDPVRDGLLQFLQLVQDKGESSARACDAGQNKSTVFVVVNVFVAVIAAVVASIVGVFAGAAPLIGVAGTVGSGAAGLAVGTAVTGVALSASVVAALVSAIAIVIANIPQLLNALAATLDAAGAAQAAGALRGAASDMSAWMDENAWFGAFLMIITCICCLLILIATLPAAGWTWVVETVRGLDGAEGLRFGFGR